MPDGVVTRGLPGQRATRVRAAYVCPSRGPPVGLLTYEATRTPTTQKERIDVVRDLIDACDDGDGAPEDVILTAAQEDHDLAPSAVTQEIQKLMDKGMAYEPQTDHYKTT